MDYISFEFPEHICPETVRQSWPEATLVANGFTVVLDTNPESLHQQVIEIFGAASSVTVWKYVNGTWNGFNHPGNNSVPISEEMFAALKKDAQSTYISKEPTDGER